MLAGIIDQTETAKCVLNVAFVDQRIVGAQPAVQPTQPGDADKRGKAPGPACGGCQPSER